MCSLQGRQTIGAFCAHATANWIVQPLRLLLASTHLSDLDAEHNPLACCNPCPCRYALYTRLNEDAASLLASCHWPPPLLPPASNQPPTASGEHASQEVQGGMDTAMAAGSSVDAAASQLPPAAITDAAPSFAGFDSPDPAHLSGLLAVLACLTSLQQACERQAFAAITQQAAGGADSGGLQPSQDAHALLDHPVLWAAVALVAPLQAKLLAHFDPSKPAGDLRRPASWLYRIALRLVQVRQGYHCSAFRGEAQLMAKAHLMTCMGRCS